MHTAGTGAVIGQFLGIPWKVYSRVPCLWHRLRDRIYLGRPRVTVFFLFSLRLRFLTVLLEMPTGFRVRVSCTRSSVCLCKPPGASGFV